jgi:hypothetical protein
MKAISDTSRPTSTAFRVRVGIFGVFGLLAVLFLVLVRPFPQPPGYHDFADQRALLGIPNALNVLSNAPFIVIGLLGVAYVLRPSVWRSPALWAAPWERWAYLLLFVFVAATGVGSAYYHLQPNTATLYWDRLPMAVVFMTFFALILADHVSPRAAAWLWLPLVAAGVLGTTHWQWTEAHGAGDLRLYGLVQFLPLLMIPVLVLAFPGRQFRTADIFAILGWYVLAKLLELLDGYIYAANGLVSGHTLKHLVASLGALWILLMLASRLRLGNLQRIAKPQAA